MRNTDATHLPADVFSTPGLILEVDRTKQFNEPRMTIARSRQTRRSADPAAAAAHPAGHPQQPGDAGPDTNYLRYTGGEHVVLGGTDAATTS